MFCGELAGVACSAEDYSFILTLCLDHLGGDVFLWIDRGSDDKSSVRSEDGWDLDDSILM